MNVALLWLLTTPHEFAHAWVATRLGDDTPQREGRVTLNPLAHVDWIGTVLLPALTSLLGAGFLGWGKPVNTNPSRLRFGLNGLALVALAGPASNIVFALVLAAVAAATAHINLSAPISDTRFPPGAPKERARCWACSAKATLSARFALELLDQRNIFGFR